MEKLVTIRTAKELKKLQQYLSDKTYIAYDTETTGVKKESEIIGFSVCAEETIGFYVVLSYWDVTQQKLVYLETKAATKEFLVSLIGKKLIMQNAPFDCMLTTSNFGIELMPSVFHDTMIGGHLLDETRSNGLKERGVELFGEDARKEQLEMKESVYRNGGVLTKEKYELYKADADLMAHYGAKDAILTLKVFYNDVPQLFDEKLDKFFYEDESMPLLRGPTYDMNTTGLMIDQYKLKQLKLTLQAEILEAEGYINKATWDYVKDKYPGTGKTNHFNIYAPRQRAWLLFTKLEQEFHTLTKSGRDLCKFLELRMPYSASDKREFIRTISQMKERIWVEEKFNKKTGKMQRAKKIGDVWNYLACGKDTMKKYSEKYKWVERILEVCKNKKLLTTYVEGIESRMQYGIINSSFLQHGTTSGRYSSKNPNFQNLPRDDKRVKSCIVSRPGKVFVGADYDQLEPRVFASFSQDKRLMECFASKDDFYSVVGMEVFDKIDCKPLKEGDKDAFGVKYKKLRDISKVVALSSAHGTTAFKMAPTIGKSTEEAREVINSYFEKFPSVKELMLASHEQAKKEGKTYNLFGRPRRMPKAMFIPKLFGDIAHEDLPYEWRNILNLAINHPIQSTGASIMNRAAIAVWKAVKRASHLDIRWNEVKIVLQVHDELILEGPEELSKEMFSILKYCMENTTKLPGVILTAKPKITNNLGDLK